VFIMEALPQAAAIWMIMLLTAALAAAVLVLPRKVAPAGPTLLLQPVDEADPAAAGLRQAAEAATAADDAAALAARLREEWERAEDEVDEAWTAYDRADAEARRVAAAAAYPVMRRRRARDENAARERFLHHAATAACRRREISIAQLNDVLAHRGWNPRLHPAAQESALQGAARDHRFAVYQRAAERERQAWAAAEEAAEALRELRAEACAATVSAGVDEPSADADWWAEQWSTAEPVRAAAA
jgi:hypothetical protein